MNREIKFRGIRKDNSEWVEGYILPHVNNPYDEIKRWYIKPYMGSDSYEVIPESIGEYTGLKDKNEVEIYENDFVKGVAGYEDEPIQIVWSGAGFKFKRLNGWYIDTSWSSKSLQVIGNQYLNPELLKQ